MGRLPNFLLTLFFSFFIGPIVNIPAPLYNISMTKVPVALEKSFLRTRLKITRQALSGNYFRANSPQSKRSKAKAAYKTIYSASQTNINGQLDTLIDSKSQLLKPPVTPLETAEVKKSEPEPVISISSLRSNWRSKLLKGTFTFFVVSSLLILLVLFVPIVYYQVFPADPVPVKSSESGTPLGGDFASGTRTPTRQVAQPQYDETLPEGTWVIIPRIGVRTEILESEKSEDALNKGVWRVPEFGIVGDVTKPMILAAHRYGYVNWWKGSQYWRYHSFYLLPDLEPGDLVIVISGKRKYLYEIYSGEEGEEISDYNADLILYTCKLLNSPVRHFRYARLLDPDAPTQTQKSAVTQVTAK
jgi:hypothetical protein